MAKKIKRRKTDKPKKAAVARPEWAKFKTSYHGQGAHRDESVYTRKVKHREKAVDDD